MAYISILIPVYNTSSYLIRALDSIPNRNDIEIIIANDASKDNSLELLFNYKKKKFLLLNYKINHGIGFIRNRLLKYATGEWICWLDSDDYFHTDEIDKVFNLLPTCNNYHRVSLKHTRNDNRKTTNTVAPWGCIYKKSLYNIENFKYERRAEDWFLLERLKKKITIKTYSSNICAYHYNYPLEGSLSWNWEHKKQTWRS